MDKNKEITGLDDLLRHLDGWSMIQQGEAPDFIIENNITKERVGIEVSEYYPNRTHNGAALVRLPGKTEAETRNNRLRFFEETDFGHSRFVPRLDVDDFCKSRLSIKEEKLESYRLNAPNCKEFWLLIMLNFYDNVVYENSSPIPTLFDRIYVWEEPHSIGVLPTVRKTL